MSNLVPYEEIFGGDKVNIWSSIDINSTEGKMKVQKALASADYGSEHVMKVPFEVQDIVVHGVKIVDENGEVTDATRTVLLSPSGETVSFTSEGVISSLRNIFSIFGLPPFNPPLKVQVKEVKTRRGWKTLNLIVVP